MAAFLLLQEHTPWMYPETAHQVWDDAEHLKQLPIQIILHWIPSHVRIFGNNKAYRPFPQPLTLSRYFSKRSEL